LGRPLSLPRFGDGPGVEERLTEKTRPLPPPPSRRKGKGPASSSGHVAGRRNKRTTTRVPVRAGPGRDPCPRASDQGGGRLGGLGRGSWSAKLTWKVARMKKAPSSPKSLTRTKSTRAAPNVNSEKPAPPPPRNGLLCGSRPHNSAEHPPPPVEVAPLPRTASFVLDKKSSAINPFTKTRHQETQCRQYSWVAFSKHLCRPCVSAYSVQAPRPPASRGPEHNL
jgi:hypothetical protein